MKRDKEWFASWFDSPYYHVLYGDRDSKEAEYFLSNLIARFDPSPGARIIDLACGSGRHSIYLNSLGFNVTGIDLSEHSIGIARCFENSKLEFRVGDLRQLQLDVHYDIALNLFTSFGYFDDLDAEELVLKQIKSILKPGAFLLIDFFNANRVIRELIPNEVKERAGVRFEIKKQYLENKIVKTICFQDQGEDYIYEEKVLAICLDEFRELFQKTGFRLVDTFGNYDLSPFHSEDSERLILLAQNPYVG